MESKITVIPDGKSKDDRPSLVDIYRVIVPQYADQWRSLGAALGVEECQLEMISQDNAHNPTTCCRAMFSKWLTLKRSATWGKLDDAISLIKTGVVSTNNVQEEVSMPNTLTIIPDGKSRDNRPFLADLYKHVPPSYALHWKALGVSLGFENYQLEMISTDNAHNSDRTLTCFRSMLFQWLCHGKASWGQMEDAINHIRSGPGSAETTGKSSDDAPILLCASDGKGGKIEPTFVNLMKCVEKVVDWKKLSVHLLNDNYGSKTMQIESNYCDVRSCRTAMIREYLTSDHVSWRDMLTALRSAGYNDIAANIEKSLGIEVDSQPNQASTAVESEPPAKRRKSEL
ncbi:uncharacterized protein [Dysidea avara]|uniref:uncharacterized protein isoform X2 n=1 Tax=Dysidea avara TaxID=196820 RepID=UPI0033179F11